MPLLSRISRRSSLGTSPLRQKLKSLKSSLSPVPVVLKESLRLIKESADVLPPLKSVAGGLYCFIQVIEDMKGNKKEVERLAHTSNALLNLLENTIPETGDIPKEVLCALEVLNSDIGKIVQAAYKIPKKHRFVRFFSTVDEKNALRILQGDLQSAIEHFKIASSVRIECKLGVISSTANDLKHSLSIISSKTDESLHRLQAMQISAFFF